MTDNDRLKEICKSIRHYDVLSALHACQKNYPIGKDDEYKWRNAHALVSQLSSPDHISGQNLAWLQSKAEIEYHGNI